MTRRFSSLATRNCLQKQMPMQCTQKPDDEYQKHGTNEKESNMSLAKDDQDVFPLEAPPHEEQTYRRNSGY